MSRPTPLSEQQTLTRQRAIELGLQHHTAGDLSKAEDIYQQILQTDPNHPEALHLLGVIAHQGGENDRAVDLITKALAINPNYAEAHNNLGNVLREMGRLDEAVASCQKALSIKPNYSEAHSNLRAAFQDVGKLDDAVASCHKAIAIKPDYVEAHNNLGLSLIKLGRLDKAEASYHEALKHTPAEEPYLPSFAFLGHPERHFWMMGTIALLQNLDRPITMLEIGTWVGSSLLTWDQSITAFHSKGGKILCIDPWEPYLKLNNDDDAILSAVAELGIAYHIFCHNKNTTTWKVDHCRGVSKEVLPGLESGSFDIVYIDGSHDYKDVVKDICEGCRLVRDGGYICGDDLEIQWNDANQDHTQKHKNEDYVQDPEGRYYHPGVTAAVYDVLGNVTCHEGYWIMQKQDGKLKQIRFEKFDYFVPSHFSPDWKNRFREYTGTHSFVVGSRKSPLEEN